MPEIAANYEKLRAEIEQIADVHVTSAIALSDAQRSGSRPRSRSACAAKCDCMRASIRPLIGGAIVRSGDLVIDGFLLAKAGLDRLALDIAH